MLSLPRNRFRQCPSCNSSLSSGHIGEPSLAKPFDWTLLPAQARLRTLGTAAGFGGRGAALLDALCGLLVALAPLPATSQADNTAAALGATAAATMDAGTADLAASALGAAEALLRHDAGARAAAIASCAGGPDAVSATAAATPADEAAGAAVDDGAAAGAAGAEGSSIPERGMLSTNVRLVGPDGALVQLPPPPWGTLSPAQQPPAALPSLRRVGLTTRVQLATPLPAFFSVALSFVAVHAMPACKAMPGKVPQCAVLH